MEGSYLYFIYRNDVPSPVYLIGKVGRGTGPRYKHYTTAYGTNYDVHIVVPTACYKAAEKDLLEWCRDKGYVRPDAETIDMPTMSDDMPWKDIKQVYMDIVVAIKDRMSIYGSVWQAYVGGKNTSLCCIADAPETTWVVPVVEKKVIPPVVDISPTDALKLYEECLSIRGYDMSWKHAARFFKDQWYKGGMHVIKACIRGRIAMDEYEMKLEHCRRKGLPDSDAVPKDEEEIHTLSRYGLMQDLRSMAIQEYADGTHTWRFKASLRNDPAWKGLMDRYDSYFNTHLMRQGHCHRDMWKMLSGVVTRELCIMHTMVDERVVDGKDRSVWWVIRFNDDDALMDVG